jgi:hypothetical protein
MWIELLLLVCVVVFLYIKLKPYLHHLVDLMETIRKIVNKGLSTAETVVDQASIGSKLVVNQAAKPYVHKSEEKGYCYLGEWDGVRTCTTSDKECPTKVYSNYQQCVNPELR